MSSTNGLEPDDLIGYLQVTFLVEMSQNARPKEDLKMSKIREKIIQMNKS